jgi:hypothetical protein
MSDENQPPEDDEPFPLTRSEETKHVERFFLVDREADASLRLSVPFMEHRRVYVRGKLALRKAAAQNTRVALEAKRLDTIMIEVAEELGIPIVRRKSEVPQGNGLFIFVLPREGVQVCHNPMCAITSVEMSEPLPACNGCGKVYYCTKICQRYDWESHKVDCD